jgi:hypothetical protein
MIYMPDANGAEKYVVWVHIYRYTKLSYLLQRSAEKICTFILKKICAFFFLLVAASSIVVPVYHSLFHLLPVYHSLFHLLRPR